MILPVKYLGNNPRTPLLRRSLTLAATLGKVSELDGERRGNGVERLFPRNFSGFTVGNVYD